MTSTMTFALVDSGTGNVPETRHDWGVGVGVGVGEGEGGGGMSV
jgi:hypothetical protein